MWMRCPNGVDTLVNDAEHIKRLLSEGGMPIPDKAIIPVYVSPEEKAKTEKRIAALTGLSEQEMLLPMQDTVVQTTDMPLLEDTPVVTAELNKKPGRGSKG